MVLRSESTYRTCCLGHPVELVERAVEHPHARDENLFGNRRCAVEDISEARRVYVADTWCRQQEHQNCGYDEHVRDALGGDQVKKLLWIDVTEDHRRSSARHATKRPARAADME